MDRQPLRARVLGGAQGSDYSSIAGGRITGYAVLTGSFDCLTPHAMNRSILIANLWWLAD
ncbi:hypothetical protein E3H11_27985 [Bradyrhizobium brasilense]|nr:hypothetical protein [Bradyrhizobium brasilense]